jgi:DNA-binding transcriptional ArsR family regulator
MPQPFEDMYIAHDPAQRRALTSPLRLELIEHFTDAPLAVRDLARRMGRRPDSLYYHVRALVDVGLVLPAGTRKRGKRDEALYKLVAPMIGMGGEEGDPGLVRDSLKAFSSAFKMAQRELRDAIESNRIHCEGDQRNHLCVRQRCRLRPAALKQVNKHLDALQKILDKEFKRPPAPGGKDGDDPGDTTQHCSFTLAMIPLSPMTQGDNP